MEIQPAVNEVTGTAAGELLAGGGADDLIRGLAGNDTLDGTGSGDDTLDGGEGIDLANLHYLPDQLQAFLVDDAGLHLFSGGWETTLVGIERVKLVNVIAAFDTQVGDAVWDAQALLYALTGEAPGIALLSEWVHEADHEPDIEDLAQGMLDHYAPGLGTEVLVRHLFSINGAALPPQETIAAIVNQVGLGQMFADNGELLAYAATETALVDRLVGFTGSVALLDAA